jgi:hypothetical protein
MPASFARSTNSFCPYPLTPTIMVSAKFGIERKRLEIFTMAVDYLFSR